MSEKVKKLLGRFASKHKGQIKRGWPKDRSEQRILTNEYNHTPRNKRHALLELMRKDLHIVKRKAA